MKKLLSLLLALALVLTLSGCITGTVQPQLPADTTAADSIQFESTAATTEAAESTVQPETGPQTETTTAQPETQPTTQPETQPATPPETQPATPPETQPATPPETQPATPPETQPATPPETQPATPPETQPVPALDKDGSYTTKEDVALYIHLYGCLPDNFMTKSQARALGWKSGSLEPYAPGCCIGGDTFQNREGLLPKAPGRTYTECDIDTMGGGSRGAKRIVFSNDGLIYYTSDHYASFTLLYGEP